MTMTSYQLPNWPCCGALAVKVTKVTCNYGTLDHVTMVHFNLASMKSRHNYHRPSIIISLINHWIINPRITCNVLLRFLSWEGRLARPPVSLVDATCPLCSKWSSSFCFQVIVSRGGRFLEAPVSGNQQLSNDGMLVILAAGDRGLYEDCSSCFQAMGKTSFFLGSFIKWWE